MKEMSPVVWTATEEDYDLTTANGRMLVNMKLTISELEADVTGERIRLVNEYKTSTGQPLTGSQPFGFTIEKDTSTGRKKIVKDPDEAPILEDMLQHYMTYQSKRKTVVYAHAKYQVSIENESFGSLLKNTMLYGAYRDNPSYCEAYIDKQTFDKIQEILKRNCKENTAENRTYIFSGLIICPECGRYLSGKASLQHRADGKVYVKKYVCPNYSQMKRCSFSKAISEKTFEKMLLDNLEQYVSEAKIRCEEIIDTNEKKVPKYDIDEINKEIERLNYSWQKGRIKTVEQYDKQYDFLLEQLELAQHEQKKTAVKDFSKIEETLNSEWRDIYYVLDEENKKAFWRNLISSIEIVWTTEVKRIDKVDFF
jgi:flagellin-specific chaperone FliS